MTVGELIEELGIYDPKLRILMVVSDVDKYVYDDVVGVKPSYGLSEVKEVHLY